MRYRILVSRVQVAERFVRALDEEAAIRQVQEELDRPYGFPGSWRTTNTDIDITEASSPASSPEAPARDGTLLLSIKEAAAHLGISRTMLYEMINGGEIHYVAIGSRKLISRESLRNFVEAHMHLGWRSPDLR